MGYMKHHTIVITGWQLDKIKETHIEAVEIFGSEDKLVSQIIGGTVNNQYSFFIAPDGNKESFAGSGISDGYRKKLLDWLQDSDDNDCEYIEIIFGGDSDSNKVIRCNYMDRKNKNKSKNK